MAVSSKLLASLLLFMAEEATSAYNTAELELYAANATGKIVKWVRVWM
jgi:hypothetical protein